MCFVYILIPIVWLCVLFILVWLVFVLFYLFIFFKRRISWFTRGNHSCIYLNIKTRHMVKIWNLLNSFKQFFICSETGLLWFGSTESKLPQLSYSYVFTDFSWSTIRHCQWYNDLKITQRKPAFSAWQCYDQFVQKLPQLKAATGEICFSHIVLHTVPWQNRTKLLYLEAYNFKRYLSMWGYNHK